MINVYDREGVYHLTIEVSNDSQTYNLRLMSASSAFFTGTTVGRYTAPADDSGDRVGCLRAALALAAADHPGSARFLAALLETNASLSPLHDPDHAPSSRFGSV